MLMRDETRAQKKFKRNFTLRLYENQNDAGVQSELPRFVDTICSQLQ